MTLKKTRVILLGLTAAGTLFAGYLSAIKLFTQGCAFNEPCPYFLGYPACWYGFAMYFTMFMIALYAVVKRPPFGRVDRAITVIAAAGTLFSGSFAVSEVLVWLGPEGFTPSTLGLPTCMYGLIFYIAILLIGIRSISRNLPVGHSPEADKK